MYLFLGPQGNIGRHRKVDWLGQGLGQWGGGGFLFISYTYIVELFSSEHVLHL